jgi:hypothetical protein
MKIDQPMDIEEEDLTFISSVEGDKNEIKYHNFSIPIKNEKLKINLKKIEDVKEKIRLETDINKKTNPFTDIFNMIDDMSKICKKERADEVNPSESNEILK